MRLLYLTDAHIPSRATNAMQTMRMCEAFVAAGADVTLVHPQPQAAKPEGWRGSLWDFYGVEPFRIITLRVPAPWTRLARVGRRVALGLYVLRASRPGAAPFVAYGRSLVAVAVARWSRRIWLGRSACRAAVLEVHDLPTSRLAAHLAGSVDGAVAISDALRAAVEAEQPKLRGRVVVEHDGVDVEALRAALPDRGSARARLAGVEAEETVVAYTGRAIPGKGVDVLLDAAPALRAQGACVLVVGKVYEEAYFERGRAADVIFTGFVPPSEVPAYLAAADVLVLSTTPDLKYASYTSPLKLFEYMASGRPVVASDLPVFREVLEDERNALFYGPRDPNALAVAVGRLQRDPALAERLAAQALADVGDFAWTRRAARILERIDLLQHLAG